MRILFVLLIGCGSDVEQVVENAGRMCLHDSPVVGVGQAPEPQSFVAGPVGVTVSLSRCLSSSCDVDPTMSCSVLASSSGLTVTSVASWTDTRGTAGNCTDDCGSVGAVCATDALPDGSYEVGFGGQTLTLVIPSEVETPCLEVAEP